MKEIPECFDLSWLKLEEEDFDGMISCDDKNYITLKDGSLMKHGSGFKGRSLPSICVKFVDDMATALLSDDITEDEVFSRYSRLDRFPIENFVMTIGISKARYHKNSLYNNLTNQLKRANLAVTLGSSLEYVKAVDGYKPLCLLDKSKIDYEYYRNRVAVVAERLLGFDVSQRLNKVSKLEKWC